MSAAAPPSEVPTGNAPLPFARSGSRLRAQYLASAGAQRFEQFFDRARGVPCTFLPMGEVGEWRCIPLDGVLHEFLLVYLDAACTQPAVLTFRGAGPVPRVWRVMSAAEGAACSGVDNPVVALYEAATTVFTGGIENAALAPQVFGLDGAVCRPKDGHIGRDVPAVTTLTAADPEGFVRAHGQRLALGGGLVLRRLVADDGSALTLGLQNEDARPCTLVRDGQCVPEPIAYRRYAGAFEDPACTEPAFAPMYGCGVPHYAVDEAGTLVFGTAEAPQLYTRGPDLSHVSAGAPLSFTCDALNAGVDPAAPAPGYAAGAPVHDLPSARSVRTGDAELHLDVFVVPGSAGEADTPVTAGTWEDRAGRACVGAPWEDGTLRCVPADVDVWSWSADERAALPQLQRVTE